MVDIVMNPNQWNSQLLGASLFYYSLVKDIKKNVLYVKTKTYSQTHTLVRTDLDVVKLVNIDQEIPIVRRNIIDVLIVPIWSELICAELSKISPRSIIYKNQDRERFTNSVFFVINDEKKILRSSISS